MTTILVAGLGERRIGFRAHDVLEVVRAVAVTPLPGAPPAVEGVIDLRGTLVPVLNLRRRFGLAVRPVALSDRLVIVRAAGRVVGLIADAVESLVEVDEAEISSASDVMAVDARIAGVVRLESGLLLVAALEAFLSQTEAEALDGAMAARTPGAA